MSRELPFKRKRLSFKSVIIWVKQYNQEHGTDYEIKSSYEYYELVRREPGTTGHHQIKRGTLRECWEALP